MPDSQESKRIIPDFCGRWTVSQLLHPLPDGWAMLGISRSTLYELITAGDLKAVKVGRRTLTPHDELERYVAKLKASAA